jgi:hypothetical protein
MGVEIRLTAPAFDFWVEVRLRSWGDRWLAVAEISGEPEIGLGQHAREALEGALAAFGPSTAQAFLADPALLAASPNILEQRSSSES